MTAFYLAVNRCTKHSIVKDAAGHNLRKIPRERQFASHIDKSRTDSNIILRGPDTVAGVVAESARLLSDAELRPRQKAVLLLEALVTLPNDTGIDFRQYFESATQWLENDLGGVVLSSVVHLDESSPHAHVLILPLINGRMIGSDTCGSTPKMIERQGRFYRDVCAPHGLPPVAVTPYQTAPQKAGAKQAIRDGLLGLVMTADLIERLMPVLALRPAKVLAALDLAPIDREATFSGMMTAPQSKARRLPDGKGICAASLPDGKGIEGAPGVAETGGQDDPVDFASRTCVGKRIETPVLTPPTAAHQAPPEQAAEVLSLSTSTDLSVDSIGWMCGTDSQLNPPNTEPVPDARPVASLQTDAPTSATPADYDRVPDDQPTEQWDADIGDWIAPAPLKHSIKHAVAASVKHALDRTGSPAKASNDASPPDASNDPEPVLDLFGHVDAIVRRGRQGRAVDPAKLDHVRQALADPATHAWSSRALARLTGVSHPIVNTMRNELRKAMAH